MIVHYIYSRVQIQCLRFVYDTLQYNTIGFFVVVVILSLPRTLNLLLLQISSTLPLPKFIQKLAAATVMHLCIFFCQSQYQNIRRTNAQAKLGLQSRALVLRDCGVRPPPSFGGYLPAGCVCAFKVCRGVSLFLPSSEQFVPVIRFAQSSCLPGGSCVPSVMLLNKLSRLPTHQTQLAYAAIPQHAHNRKYARCVFVCISNFKLCRLML